MALTRLVVVTVAVAACAQDPGTAVRLELTYEAAWRLDRLDLELGDVPASTRIAKTVVVLLPDAWAGQAMPITVVAMRAGERYAAARVAMTPALGREIAVDVVLTRLPCGAWCTPGATTCMGDGVAICQRRDRDACTEWSEPAACSSSAPSCSLGVCADQCIEECVAGETRCDGPLAEAACGNADGDGCRDWLPSVACTAGETCSNGACRATCADECAAGATVCRGNGVATCGDLDFDGCLEWGPAAACDAGTTCSNGACATGCTDECSGSTCDGLALKACGNFDFDPCKDLSPGMSCVPADPCRDGMCTVGGCTSAPKVCNDPPASTCVDDSTVRSYDAAGTCTATGACEYTPHDATCADGCANGACVGGCPSGQWQVTRVDAAGSVGFGTSVAVDRDGGVHVGYYDQTNGDLEYAYKAPGAGWATPDRLDVAGDVGRNPSLEVDAAGGVHIAYETVGELKYIYKAPGAAWAAPAVIDGSAWYASLVVDGAGGVHVSYYDALSSNLSYVYKPDGGAWTTPKDVDSMGDVGEYSSLAVDGAGGVHVAYWDGANLDLKYAYKPVGGAWATPTTVDSTGEVGTWTSLAVDGAGGVHISYYEDYTDVTNGNLKYAYKSSGATWTTTPVDLGGSGDVGEYTSLAVDGAGGVHISYYDTTNGDLKYTSKPSGGAWATPTTVESTGDVGEFTSLVLDGAGGVHISYLDVTNRDLKYANRCP